MKRKIFINFNCAHVLSNSIGRFLNVIKRKNQHFRILFLWNYYFFFHKISNAIDLSNRADRRKITAKFQPKNLFRKNVFKSVVRIMKKSKLNVLFKSKSNVSISSTQTEGKVHFSRGNFWILLPLVFSFRGCLRESEQPCRLRRDSTPS